MKSTIPKIPHRFFRWYCRSERYEELHGDLEELFYLRMNESGIRKARLFYLWDVIRCCKPYAWKKTPTLNFTQGMMIKNYFKVSVRNLMKNPLNSFINVFGLSIAIGICLVVYAFWQYTYGTDQFHGNKHSVYLTTFSIERDGREERYGNAPTPLGEMLRADFANIKKVCRVEDRNVALKLDDKVFYERVRLVDTEFLEMFTFPLKWGQAKSLAEPSSIILSEDMAVKYFGDENPVGRDVLMIFGENQSKAFKVTGVAQPFPKSHAIHFDFLVNFENLKIIEPDYDFGNWGTFVKAMLIQVNNPADMRAIEQGMEKYKKLQNEKQPDWPISSFAFEPLASLHERSGEIQNDISLNPPTEARIALPLIGIFMLCLACFNYINIAIVSATRRLKEIGVRKVIGANRGKLIFQFLSENVFITFFATTLGLILGVTFFVPGFVSMTSNPLELSLTDTKLWLFLLGILLFTGIASGTYPAFYISRFEPLKIFKGSLQFGKKNPVTKTFLAFQLVLACILITGAVMFTQNTAYQSVQSWGYEQKGALYVHVPDQPTYDRMHDALAQNKNVLSISGSEHHLGMGNGTAVLHINDRDYETQELSVDAHYFQTMGIRLVEGRTFHDRSENDKKVVVVNQFLVKNMGWEKPIGQQFEIGGTKYEVVGVVKDFHSYNFYYEIRPIIFKLANKPDYRFLSVRAQPGSEKETHEALQSQWAKLFPELPFQGGYQEDVWGDFYESTGIQVRFMSVVAFIAVLLASLGLYGLVTLNVSGRVKEFSIRKVLGADLPHITVNISRQYFVLTSVAIVVGAPVSYIMISVLIDSMYAFPMPMTFSGVVIAVAILLLIMLAVISTQVRKLARSNPINGLKAE